VNVPSRANFGVLLIATAVLAMPSTLPAASAAYQAAIETSAPVLYYQFNEASGAAVNYGSLGAAYNATYFGAPTLQAPTLEGDSGVAFNTGADYLESLGVVPAGLIGNPTFSAEALFFVPQGGTCSLWAPFLHWGPSDGGGTTARSVYFSFSNNDPTSAFAGFYNGGLKSASGSLPLGRWHLFIWVRVGGGTALDGTTVYLDGEEVTGVASTKDISAGGLYMNTQAVIPEGAMLLVRIPFRRDAEVVCRAEVIYSEPGRGLGVRFRDLTDEARAMLERELAHG